MTASVPVDWQLTDTYFVVAHIHYVLIGINVFPVIGGIYYWFPKMTGRMLDERLGQVELLDHVHRLQSRRSSRCTSSACSACRGASTPTRAGMGWDGLNLITTIGSFLFALGRAAAGHQRRLQPAARRAAGPIRGTRRRSNGRRPRRRRPTISASSRIVASRHPLWEDRLRESDRALVLIEAACVLDHGHETAGRRRRSTLSRTASSRCRKTAYAPFILAMAASAGFCGLLLTTGGW